METDHSDTSIEGAVTPGPGTPTDDARSQSRRLLSASFWAICSTLLLALSGMSFWVLAARTSTVDEVGLAAALYGYVVFLAEIGSLGLPVVVARFASGIDQTHRRRFLGLGTIGAAVEFTVGVAFVAIVDSEALDALLEWSLTGGALFVGAACAGTSLAAIADTRALALGRHGLLVARSLVVVVGRLVLIPLALTLGGPGWLFAASVLPVIVSGVGGLMVLARPLTGWYSLRTDDARRSVLRCMGANHGAQLVSNAPIAVVPVIVSLTVDPAENAAFFVAWGFTGMCFVLPTVVGNVVLAQSGHDHALGHVGPGTLPLALQVTATGMLVVGLAVLPLRLLVPAVYGSEYQRTADLLPLLVVAGVCWAVSTMMLTLNRIRHADRTVLLIGALVGLLSVVPAAVLTVRYGTDGTAVGWFVGNLAGAVAAVALTPTWTRRGPTLREASA